MAQKHIRIRVDDEGCDIYAPREGQSWGYRYGPSIICRDGQSADAWFASPGAAGEADWFTYRHTGDGGVTWSDEVVVLTPTADSMDWFSVCDPAVIRFGGWYYLGYTSTVFPQNGGVCNNAFVCRSRNPDGPFEKWTGSGWGETRGDCRWMGKPAPIIYFDELCRCWGAGELSFVVLDDTLYIYYTWTSLDLDGRRISQTRVATADARDENWPANITPRGVATVRNGGSHDSFDVVYCEELEKFVAISTDRRFTKDSMLAVYESDDGLRFVRVNELKTNIGFMCHNSGISGDELHHIRRGDLMLLGYAYGNKWGYWGTRFHRYTFEECDDFYSQQSLPCVEREVVPWKLPEELWSINITTVPHYCKLHVSEKTQLTLLSLDTRYEQTKLNESDPVVFYNYDPDIVSFSGLTATAENPGYTYVTAEYKGRKTEFLIYVYPEDVDLSPENNRVTSYRPTLIEYTASLGAREQKQIRGTAVYANTSWAEVCGDRYEMSDPSVASVDSQGLLTPRRVGETEATVSLGDFSYKVKIIIKE